jgi:Phospholipase_D-nuclease N-terminal/Short C-terminal domain
MAPRRTRQEENRVTDFSLWEFLGSLVLIYVLLFALLIIFWVVLDIFRSHDIGGWAKALWLLLLVALPLIGVLAYLIARGSGMAERHYERQEAATQDIDGDARRAGDSGGNAAGQIAAAADLLASGAITQPEFEALKAKALG